MADGYYFGHDIVLPTIAQTLARYYTILILHTCRQLNTYTISLSLRLVQILQLILKFY